MEELEIEEPGGCTEGKKKSEDVKDRVCLDQQPPEKEEEESEIEEPEG